MLMISPKKRATKHQSPGCVFDLPLAYNLQGVSSEEPRPKANSGLLLVRYVNIFGN